jgi:uncharacterized membrane protein
MAVSSEGRKADVNKYVGAVLVVGVILSFVILSWGSILYLLHPTVPRTGTGLLETLSGASKLNPWATINLGLMVLLATPVTRIVAAAIAFAIERQFKFLLISMTVLVILSISVTYGTLRKRQKTQETPAKSANTHSLRYEQRNR